MNSNLSISESFAKKLWIQAQGLHQKGYFGKGKKATTSVIEHLGYVQIDTINVIERCHHHILYSRIPDYHIKHLQQAQSKDKTIFEYWTHALAYVPIKDYRFFKARMEKNMKSPHSWYDSVKKEDLRKLIDQIKKNGPLSIRDIKDEVLVEKNHAWDSRKPSKKALQLGFNQGKLVISERVGMLKKYGLFERHFDHHFDRKEKIKPATELEINEYILQRGLKSQALVSLDSLCYLEPARKPAMRLLLQKHVQSKKLVSLFVDGHEKVEHWINPELLSKKIKINDEQVHILSPFDPLIIQRKRLKLFFNYQHIFEAYIPKEKRIYGYFSLPVMINCQIIAVLDLKIDREIKRLLIQKWTWVAKYKSAELKRMIENELQSFEKFQLQSSL